LTAFRTGFFYIHPMQKWLSIFFTFAVVFLSSCTDFSSLKFSGEEGVSSSSELSSSSEEGTSSSSSLSSSSDAGNVETSSSSSSEGSVASSSSGTETENTSSSSTQSSNSVPMCEGAPYNTATGFCVGDKYYKICNGLLNYDVTQYICSEDDRLILAKCNDVQYNPVTQKCENNVIKTKCGSETNWYNAINQGCCANSIIFSKETQKCEDNIVLTLCGSNWYNALTHFCYNNATYTCNNQPYDPSKQFCYNEKKVADFCGNRMLNSEKKLEYDPNLYECKPSINANGIYLKSGVSDGVQSYNAVLIGTQVWMAENLNYDVPDNTTDVCYKSAGVSNCNTYGRYYNWTTAMASSSSSTNNPSGVRGICPSNWHLPSKAEWETLVNYIRSDKSCSGCEAYHLKAKEGWVASSGNGNGLDSYGFYAKAGGYGNSGTFYENQVWSYWLSSTEKYILCLAAGNNASFNSVSSANPPYYNQSYLYSVRCVKD